MWWRIWYHAPWFMGSSWHQTTSFVAYFASSAFSSSSSTMRPCSRSISSILPGCSRHLRTIESSLIGSTPLSLAMTTRSPSVTQ